MMLEIVFAYLAGVLTLLNPCVLPILPIVLGSAIQQNKHAPMALAAGMSIAFVAVGMFIPTVGRALGITDTIMTNFGASLMLVFGLVLLLPTLNARFQVASSGLSNYANSRLNQHTASGLKGQFLGGILLGFVWSPCIGPTLGGAIALASQGQHLFWAFLIMLSFALGVSTFIIGLSYGSRNYLKSASVKLTHFAKHSKTILGIIFIAVGLMLLFKVHYMIDQWFVQYVPYWFQDLSTMF